MEMVQKESKVVHLPVFKRQLEKIEIESELLIKERDFQLALEKIDTLLGHQHVSKQININKMICLIELDRWEEAEIFSESLIANRHTDYYYDYLEFYLLVLFETEQYSLCMQIIDEEMDKEEIPQPFLSKYRELHHTCYEWNSNLAKEISQQMELAIISENHQQQWLLFHRFEQLYVSPPELFIQMLQMETVHPVLKTNIIRHLQQHRVDREITIIKGQDKMTTTVLALPPLKKHPCYVDILKRTEQSTGDNPTLLHFVEELLDHYSEVCYPFYYPKEDAPIVAIAFLTVSQMHFQLTDTNKAYQITEKTADYCKQIQACNEIYFKMMLY